MLQPEQAAVQVDDAPVLVDHLDRDDALRGGDRDRQAGGHVLDDAGGGAAERDDLVVGGCFRRRGDGESGGQGFEEFLPLLVYFLAVVAKLLAQLVFEPAIDPRITAGLSRHRAGFEDHDSGTALLDRVQSGSMKILVFSDIHGDYRALENG